MQNNIEKTIKSYLPLILLWFFILIIWCANWYFLADKAMEARGTFGDMFGGINALFTGLAFATLIYTTWMQKEELALQREELAATRSEMKGQKEQLEQQSKTFELQRFETTLFSLLSIHESNLESVSIYGSLGASAFRLFWDSIKGEYERHPAIFINNSSNQILRLVIDDYETQYSKYHEQLGRYFRHLYRIFKFIHLSNIENKKWYASIIRAQLTSAEQIVLFYNCLSCHGKEKFKPLVEEYSLLNNLPIEFLIQPEHKILFQERAYD